MRFIIKRPSDVARADPSIFNPRQTSLIKCHGAFRSLAESANVLMPSYQRDEDNDRHQRQPSGNDVTDGEPYHREKDQAGEQPYIPDQVIEPSKALDLLKA